LITFKSHRDALDDWTLKDLTGHYVNYRKQCSARDQPLPEADFRLYAVCSRYPHNLASRVQLAPARQGVYERGQRHDSHHCGRSGIARAPQRALAPVQCVDGNGWLRGRSLPAALAGYELLVGRLLGNYQGEGIAMSYTMADYRRDTAAEYLKELTPEERRSVLRSLTAEERQEGLTLEQRLAGLSAEEIAAYLKKLKSKGPAQKAKRRRKH